MAKNNWLKAGRMDTGVKVTIAVVLVVIVGWWILISQTDDPGRSPATSETNTANASQTIPERILLDNDLEILFKKEVRCDNADVNQFVADFLNVLAGKRYKQYRLMVTQQRDPIGKSRFVTAYDRLSRIEVTGVDKIENPKLLDDSELKMEPPVYRPKAHVVLRDNSEREVELILFRESGAWVSSN